MSHFSSFIVSHSSFQRNLTIWTINFAVRVTRIKKKSGLRTCHKGHPDERHKRLACRIAWGATVQPRSCNLQVIRFPKPCCKQRTLLHVSSLRQRKKTPSFNISRALSRFLSRFVAMVFNPHTIIILTVSLNTS